MKATVKIQTNKGDVVADLIRLHENETWTCDLVGGHTVIEDGYFIYNLEVVFKVTKFPMPREEQGGH